MLATRGKMTWGEVPSTPPRRPEAAGRYWLGVPHSDLLQAIQKDAARRGKDLAGHQAFISEDGNEMAASACLAMPKGKASEVYALGVTTSNARRRALRVYAGVTEEGVGFPLLLLPVRTKHTPGLLPEALAADIFDYLQDSGLRRIRKEIRYLKRNKLSYSQACVFLCLAGGKNTSSTRGTIMPWSRIGRIDALFRSLCRDDDSATRWDLLKCFAQVAKMNPPLEQMRQIWEFSRLMKGEKDD